MFRNIIELYNYLIVYNNNNNNNNKYLLEVLNCTFFSYEIYNYLYYYFL